MVAIRMQILIASSAEIRLKFSSVSSSLLAVSPNTFKQDSGMSKVLDLTSLLSHMHLIWLPLGFNPTSTRVLGPWVYHLASLADTGSTPSPVKQYSIKCIPELGRARRFIQSLDTPCGVTCRLRAVSLSST
uniref:Uncharacterized protein n=1 Tax=Timema cristinae TaxID=61476 RepID=A0A7R9H356_TIMCR|nr:unnamed protein product [Timema cristinae]